MAAHRLPLALPQLQFEFARRRTKRPKLWKNLKGKRFGRLTVIRALSMRNKSGALLWVCRCDCGGCTVVCGSDLLRGHQLGCGCIVSETSAMILRRWLKYRNELNEKKFLGRRFGRLVVLRKEKAEPWGTYWRCVCDCGKETVVIGRSLIADLTLSCGCLAGIVVGFLHRTHGLSLTPEYRHARQRAIYKAGKDAGYTPEQLKEKLAYYGWRCRYCHIILDASDPKTKLTWDHAIPVTRRSLPIGLLSNLLPACGSCNSRKNNKTFFEFTTGAAADRSVREGVAL
jgi:hypothetical protein